MIHGAGPRTPLHRLGAAAFCAGDKITVRGIIILLDVPSGIPAPGTQPSQRNTAFNNARNISEP